MGQRLAAVEVLNRYIPVVVQRPTQAAGLKCTSRGEGRRRFTLLNRGVSNGKLQRLPGCPDVAVSEAEGTLLKNILFLTEK